MIDGSKREHFCARVCLKKLEKIVSKNVVFEKEMTAEVFKKSLRRKIIIAQRFSLAHKPT